MNQSLEEENLIEEDWLMGRWVFGGIDRLSGNAFLVVVEKRCKHTYSIDTSVYKTWKYYLQ
jgi:hypothetical protein